MLGLNLSQKPWHKRYIYATVLYDFPRLLKDNVCENIYELQDQFSSRS